jgi:hypothetical protein
LVRIGANRGCDRSFAAGSTALAAGRAAVARLLARAGVVAAIVVFLVTVLITFRARYRRERVDTYTNTTGMDRELNVLDELMAKCINGLSNSHSAGQPGTDGNQSIRPPKPDNGACAWSQAGPNGRNDRQNGRSDVVGGDMLRPQCREAAA